jgi:hypothetical protein
MLFGNKAADLLNLEHKDIVQIQKASETFNKDSVWAVYYLDSSLGGLKNLMGVEANNLLGQLKADVLGVEAQTPQKKAEILGKWHRLLMLIVYDTAQDIKSRVMPILTSLGVIP